LYPNAICTRFRQIAPYIDNNRGKEQPSKGVHMKKYMLAIAVASGALFSLSAQAAPVVSSVAGVESQVTSSAEQVHHCRYWSGGWGCGYGHSRYWSHRRWGSHGWGHGRHWSHRRYGSWGW
jgi:hypothetical protein